MKLTTVVKLPFLITKALGSAALAATVGVVSRPAGWTYGQNLKYSLLQHIIKISVSLGASPEPNALLKIYAEYQKSRNESVETVSLANDTVGCWVGSSTAKKVLLFFHGGGYIVPGTLAHFQVVGDIVSRAKAEGHELAILVVQYGLTPANKFPQQLIQGATALEYLLTTKEYQPQDIIIAGDSAGAHLAISLTSHLKYVHKAAPNIDLQGQKLRGLFLMSPWVTFDQSSVSFTNNARYDYIFAEMLTMSSGLFIGDAKVDPYTVPLSADPSWWQDLPVQSLGVSGGEYEIFVDDIKAWIEKVKVHNPTLESIIGLAEVHEAAIANRALGLEIPTTEKFFQEWVMKQL